MPPTLPFYLDRFDPRPYPTEELLRGDLHRRSAGTGLGLAISRQLVRQMGSEIRLEAPAGGGSLFWFEATGPLVARPSAPPASAAS